MLKCSEAILEGGWAFRGGERAARRGVGICRYDGKRVKHGAIKTGEKDKSRGQCKPKEPGAKYICKIIKKITFQRRKKKCIPSSIFSNSKQFI